MKDYSYAGNVSSYESKEGEPLVVILYDPEDETKSPAMVTAPGTVGRYLYDLSNTDHEEKYMRKVFRYNPWCSLTKVKVLDDTGRVVKTVEEGSDYSEYID